ncbi:MAG: RHS repeat-associated core domain-containing protein [Bacteroidota bacterium]
MKKTRTYLLLCVACCLMSKSLAQVTEERPEDQFNTVASKTYTYDENGVQRLLSTGKSYFDYRGQLLQSQTKALTKDLVFASQPVYDKYDRPVVKTLPAPTGSDQFKMLHDFVTSDGEVYTHQHIEAESTAPVDSDSPLGAYFSIDNALEPATPISRYPLSFTAHYPDGTGEVKAGAGPGEVFHTHASKRTYSKTFPVFRDLDGIYLDVRNHLLGDNTHTLANQLVKQVSRDVNGKEVVSYLEGGENVLASGYSYLEGPEAIEFPIKHVLSEELLDLAWIDIHIPNTKSSPEYVSDTGLIDLFTGAPVSSREALKGFYRCKKCSSLTYRFTYYNLSFNFYDAHGRLIVSVPPKGVGYLRELYEQGYKIGDHTGDIPYATYYEYDFEGHLLETREPDAGTTRFMYRKDGTLRFSENALQRAQGVFSYTNYDWNGRPIESGVYVGSDFSFGSEALKGQLENLSPGGGIITADADRAEYVQTHYDLPYPPKNTTLVLPGEQTHTFLGVAHTASEHAETWYSYDELARTTWVATWYKDMPGSPVKTVHYTYDFTGNVTTVAYQKEAPDAFYHHYVYDADNRLSKVYAGTSPIDPAAPDEQDLQATYHYYLHGPLKQVVLADGIQETDFYYTLQGWLKSINNPSILRDDEFAQSFHYYPDDYQSAEVSDNFGHAFNGVPQYGGTISSLQWNTQRNPLTAFNYTYDNQYQLQKAGSVDGSTQFQVDQLAYDAHGNLLRLRRKDERGNDLHDLTYHYKETGDNNKLSHVDGYAEDFEYDAIGQLIRQTKEGKKTFITYNVSGYVTGVYADGAHTQPILTNTYDDKGFRLSKTAYDSTTHEPTFRTWYVRDAAGAELTVYVENLKTGSAPLPYEVPIYGANRLGMYRPAEEAEVYELKDHLGNVRALVGARESVRYKATVESELATEEEAYFEINKRTMVASHLNHTPAGEVETPNEAIRINNRRDANVNPIGMGQVLQVVAGDRVKAWVYAKYEDFDLGNNTVVPMMGSFLSETFSESVVGVEGKNIFEAFDGSSLPVVPMGDFNERQPRMYLNYLLFDQDFKLREYGFTQVTKAARVPTDGTPLDRHAFERLRLGIDVGYDGFLFVYVSNENREGVNAYFDDLEVEHVLDPLQKTTDYYPFGLAQEARTFDRTGGYRLGYQGDFAEYDKETGWNHFEVRELDPVMGRWLSVDPARQFWSPYVSMGNNPINAFDPDGAFAVDPPSEVFDLFSEPYETVYIQFRANDRMLGLTTVNFGNFIKENNFFDEITPTYFKVHTSQLQGLRPEGSLVESLQEIAGLKFDMDVTQGNFIFDPNTPDLAIAILDVSFVSTTRSEELSGAPLGVGGAYSAELQKEFAKFQIEVRTFNIMVSDENGSFYPVRDYEVIIPEGFKRFTIQGEKIQIRQIWPKHSYSGLKRPKRH